jgi:TIR domain
MRGGVFICYRREDSAGFAGRIYDRLKNSLGHESVFIDVDNIPMGLDFVEVLSDRVGRCDALIAVIGRKWIASADKANRRRLDDSNDYVRIEIEAALSRNVPVIPVLIDGAVMPNADDLPAPIKKLARRQGIEISHTRFDSDAARLTEALTQIGGEPVARALNAVAARQAALAPEPGASRAHWLLPVAAALIAIAVGAGLFYTQWQAQEGARGPVDMPHASFLPGGPPAAMPAENVPDAAPPAPRLGDPGSAAAPAPKAGPDVTATGKIGDSPPAKIGKPISPDVPSAQQQWMNREDFSLEQGRQLAAGNYPEKIWGRCQDGVPQAGAHWLPRPRGQYFLIHGRTEQDFKADAADMLAKGFRVQIDNTFKDCDGTTRHQTVWMKEG